MSACPALDSLVHALGEGGFNLRPGCGLFLFARPHPGLAEWRDLTGWQPWKQHAEAWEADGKLRMELPGGKWPVVLALPGKSRDETLATFAMGYDALETGGVLLVALANDSGAARYESELAEVACGIESIQKHKCRAFLARRDGAWNERLIAEWRDLTRPTEIAGTPFSTMAGIFSAGRVDAGSALLAMHLPASLRGRVADLGAGWGFLSHAVLRGCPGVERMDLFEADARALEMARGNLCAFERSHALGFHWHDVVKDFLEAGAYDAVVMNPPFHEGQRTDVALGEAFLAAASTALRRGGTLAMVANRQLPYEATLARIGMHPRLVAQDATYKVLTARK